VRVSDHVIAHPSQRHANEAHAATYSFSSFSIKSWRIASYGVPNGYTFGSFALFPGSFTCCPTPKDSTSNPWSRSAACASMLRFWFDAQTMANRIATDVHARLRRSCEPDEA